MERPLQLAMEGDAHLMHQALPPQPLPLYFRTTERVPTSGLWYFAKPTFQPDFAMVCQTSVFPRVRNDNCLRVDFDTFESLHLDGNCTSTLLNLVSWTHAVKLVV